MNKRILIAIAAILLVLAFYLYPRPVLVADGRFQLTVHVPEQHFDSNKILAAYCWSEKEATYALENGPRALRDVHFSPLDVTGTLGVIELPFSSKHSTSGAELSYHEPLFLVIQIPTDTVDRRLLVQIPDGRGPRQVCIPNQ